ncbi:hypothetical protein BDW74DRAFT_184255 [Aspergillus multicolor]|uniref:uncharacterized protein n=1 Tax=Aspergillus multicolor TaxID=41759 RepID=UPI003CCCC6A1
MPNLTKSKSKHPTANSTFHPGSTPHEIANEPDWSLKVGRYAGITHIGEELAEDPHKVQEAKDNIKELKEKVQKGGLLDFREMIEDEKRRGTFHLKHPGKRPPGWRYVPNFTEDWVKMKQDWPTNVRRKQKKEEEKSEEERQEKQRKGEGMAVGMDGEQDGYLVNGKHEEHWHPGGSVPILAHAGRVHHETSEEYASIHDDYATQKLQECILGVVTDKAKKFIEKNAAETRKQKEQSAGSDKQALQGHR